MNYNVSGSMAPDKNAIIERYPARSNIEDRVRTLEIWMSQMKEAFNAIGRAATGLNTPPPQLPMEEPLQLLCDRGQSPVEYFGLDKSQKAHWVDVYSRLVAAKKIHADEVTSANFTFLMCGEGTPAIGPIHWYGTTRELAYMVRRHLNSRWEVALISFKDKNNKALPKTLKNTKAPCDNSAQKMDYIFRKKD